MLKIADKLRLLALCLSLFVGSTLTLSAEADDENANVLISPKFDGQVEGKNEGAEDKTNTNEDVPTDASKTANVIAPDNKESLSTDPQVDKQKEQEKQTIDDISQKTKPDLKSDLEPEPKSTKDDGVFYIIVIAFGIVLVLLMLTGFVIINSVINKLNNKLKEVEKKSKDNASSESEDFTKLFTKRSETNNSYASEDDRKLKELEDRITLLEKKVDKLLQRVEFKIVEPPRKEERMTESTQRYQRDFYRKNESITNTLRSLPDIQKIIAAFNEMMRETKGLSFINARQKFINDYKAVTFKCVNSEERVNHPEVTPRFATCAPSDSSLWGVSLVDGTLVVLPGLREYESIAHNQGGLKEIFDTGGYRNGTYRKIEVIKAARMTSDFQLIGQGKLSLSQF